MITYLKQREVGGRKGTWGTLVSSEMSGLWVAISLGFSDSNYLCYAAMCCSGSVNTVR